MKISIARTAGFCMGVRRAVDLVLDAANLSDDPVFTFGPLIHNPQVLEMLARKGICRLDTIPEKGRGVVLIRAHGVPPEDEQALTRAGFTVIDATCPRVVRVQVIINKYAQKGYATIIVGDEKHPEVKGLLGYAKGKGYTVTSLDQLMALPVFEKAVVVAQTTQNTQFYEQIKTWCKTHAAHYELFDTICGSTERRQNEVRDLASTHDAVIVVGGKESGNTRRLAQVAREAGTQATHVEDASKIDYQALSHARSIAITAGASTPNWIIKETCHQVKRAMNRQHPVAGRIMAVFNFLLHTNLLLAAGAGCLTFGAALIQQTGRTWTHAAMAMFYVLSMQIMNNMLTIGADTYNKPDRAAFYTAHKTYLLALAFVSGVLGLYLAHTMGWLCFSVLMAMSLLGFLYNIRLLPALAGKRRVQRIKDIPGSKTILIAAAWGIVTSLLPAMASGAPFHLAALALVFSTGLVFGRTAFADTLAIQGDRIAGRETLPILLGGEKSLAYVRYSLGISAAAPIVRGMLPGSGPMVVWLALVPLCMLLLTKFHKEDNLLSQNPYELMFEASFLIAGVIALIS